MNRSVILEDIPHDHESEQAVLGAIIYDNDSIYEALRAIKSPTYFYSSSHQYIFRAMLELLEKKKPIDDQLIGDELKKTNQLDEVGGYSYITSLYDCAPSSMNVFYYASIIAEHAFKRQLISLTIDTSKKSRDPEYNATELIDDTINKLMEIRQNLGNETLVKTVSECLPEIRDKMELAAAGKFIHGLITKFDEIDKITGGGLPKTELIIIGARPSVGKTSLAVCLGVQAAYMGKKCLFISLESGRETLIRDRLMSSITNINSYKLRSGKLSQEEWERFDGVPKEITDNFKVTEKTGMNCNDIYSLAKIEYEKYGLALLIIDFVQLTKPSKKHSRRDQELGEVAEKFKDIAKDFNIPVVALSQLNRDVEKTKRKPNYADLRDSGELEQIADIIILLHQEENPEDEKVIDLIFGKNRNGKKATVHIEFIKEFTRFQNL